MKKDTMKTLFESLKGTFDEHETPQGHEKRFLERLNAANKATEKKRNRWQPVSIAASVMIILGLGFSLIDSPDNTADLASVSPEMEQTQTFFTTAINNELEKLKSFETPETKALVDDALNQITILEQEYQQLRVDLVESGNDKRVIHAMIANFQSRIDLLEQMVAMIEDIKHLKTNENETTI